jgi:hypothetical protein
VIIVKKIFSLLVGLLLLGSAFGMASVMADEIGCYGKAGDILTIWIYHKGTECETFVVTNTGTSQMVLISGPVCFDDVVEETNYKVTEYSYYVRNAGTLDITVDGYVDRLECKVFPRPYPMQKYMDIIGFGQKK